MLCVLLTSFPALGDAFCRVTNVDKVRTYPRVDVACVVCFCRARKGGVRETQSQSHPPTPPHPTLTTALHSAPITPLSSNASSTHPPHPTLHPTPAQVLVDTYNLIPADAPEGDVAAMLAKH
jgi:hypothetical protein